MTYVEFFTETALENICACLTYIPDRVIYVGDSRKVIRSAKRRRSQRTNWPMEGK